MDDEDEKHASILSYAWKDSGVIYFMSTCYWGRDTIMVERQSGALVVEVPAPVMAQEYYIRMRRVDIADQLWFSYCIQQKTWRWYLSLFY
jgi:hypothetical protein